jgi:hypothetical protein
MFAARAQRSPQCGRLNLTMLSERKKILHLLPSVRNLIHFAYIKLKAPPQSVDFKNYVFSKQTSQNTRIHWYDSPYYIPPEILTTRYTQITGYIRHGLR